MTSTSDTAQNIMYHRTVTNSGRHGTHVDSREEHFLQTSGSQVTQTSTVSPSTDTLQPRANVQLNLFSVLLESAAMQAFTQIQSSIDQVQQSATKLTKGLRQRPPGYPPGPSGDSAASMLLDPLGFLQNVTSTYQPVVGLIMGGEEVILVADPAAAQQVLIDKAAIYQKEGTAFFPGSSLAGNGLLVSDGTVWQRQRQLTNPGFRRAAVETYAAAMCSATGHMLAEVWSQGGVRDVYADFNELTLNITTNALFGVDMSSSQALGISEAVRVAFEFFSQRAALGFAIPEWLPTPDNLQYHAAVSQLDSAVYGIIEDRKQQLSVLQASSQHGQCLLDNLLQSKDENGEGLSMQSLRDQLMTLLVAGQETSAILLGWTTAFLAQYPEVQALAAAEVQQVLQGQSPTPDSIKQLPYLEAVVLETLRLRPPAYIVGRCAAEADDLAGYHVQPGTTILVSPYIMHRSEQAWQDPQSFKPERWCEYQQQKGSTTSSSTTRSNSSISNPRSNSSSGSSTHTDSSGAAPDRPSSTSSPSASNSEASGSCHQEPVSSDISTISSGAAPASSAASSASNTSSVHAVSAPASDARQATTPGAVPKQSTRPGGANPLSGMGPNGAYIPFGAGPRNCIGTGFAMMEAMLVTSAALQKFVFEPISPNQGMPEAQPRITLRPTVVKVALKLR